MHGVSVGWCGIDRLFPSLALLNYHCMTILPLITATVVLLALAAFYFHARATSIGFHEIIRTYITGRTIFAFTIFLLITFPFGQRIKIGQWTAEPWMWLFYRWLLLLIISLQLFVWLHGRRRHFEDPSHVEEYNNRHVLSHWIFVALIMGIIFLETNFISWRVLEHVPHIDDSIAQLFQAKTLSIRRWYLDPPPVPEAFRYAHVVLDDKWYGIYPPGFPLVLMIGVLAGVPWLVNPFLAMLTVPALYLYARRIYDARIARFAVVLLCLSPFFLVMESGMMNHPLTLLVLLLFALSLEYAKRHQSAFLLSGFLAGYAFIIRPLTALGIGIPLGIYFLYEQKMSFPRLAKGFCLFLLALLPCAGLMILSNVKTTGDPFVSGYQKYFDNNPLGFGSKPWGGNPAGFITSRQVNHTPVLGIVNLCINLNSANFQILGWPIASLLPVVYLWMRRKKTSYEDRKMLLICLGLCIAYIFYYYQDLCYGPRNVFEALPFAVILIARGLYAIRDDVGGALRCSRSQIVKCSLAVLFAMVFITMVTTVPRLYHRYWRNYWRVTGELRSLVLESDLENALVFVHPSLDYGNGFQLNPPDMHSGPLFPEDLGPEIREKVIRAYPDRRVFYAVEEFVREGRAIPMLTETPPD